MEISIVRECHEIKAVCEKYGYGNVMEWASALWRYDYMKKVMIKCLELVSYQRVRILSKQNLSARSHTDYMMIS